MIKNYRLRGRRDPITEIVYQTVLQSEGILTAIRLGIVNISALARVLSPLVSQRLERRSNQVGVALILRRLLPIIRPRIQHPLALYLNSIEIYSHLEMFSINCEKKVFIDSIFRELTKASSPLSIYEESSFFRYYGDDNRLIVIADFYSTDLLSQKFDQVSIPRQSELTLIKTKWRPTENDIDCFRSIMTTLYSHEVSVIFSQFSANEAIWLMPDRHLPRAQEALQPFFKPDKPAAKKPDWEGEGDPFVL
jgi:hypothetical protein